MPNTIWAKMHIPYSSPELLGKLVKKISGGIEFLYVFNLIFMAVFLFFLKKNKEEELKDIKFWLIISFFIFALIAGKNWGYNGRMFLAIMPIMVIFFVSQVSNLSDIKLTISDQTREWVLNEKSKFYIIVFILSVTFIINTPLLLGNITRALTGGYYQGKPMPSFIYNKLHDKYSDSHSFGVTPENYKITGTTIDEMREILGLKTIKFMVPDVGGLGLCCEKINVLDSALLTNQYLAKQGYSQFENLLEMETPDIIETHGIWSNVTSIYNKKYFQDNYIPFIVNRNFFWLNKKYLDTLIKDGKLKEITKSEIPKKTRYLGNTIDEKYLQTYTGNYYTIKSK